MAVTIVGVTTGSICEKKKIKAGDILLIVESLFAEIAIGLTDAASQFAGHYY